MKLTGMINHIEVQQTPHCITFEIKICGNLSSEAAKELMEEVKKISMDNATVTSEHCFMGRVSTRVTVTHE